MKCPKCGFVQPENPECLNCGVLVDRYKPDQERPATQPQVPPPTFQMVDGDPFSKPIRPGLRFVRTGAGIVGMVVGGWLFGAGQNLELAPLQVLFLIGYACVSLFWIISFPIRVPVRQFAVEMFIFVVATLLLRVALPAAFDLGRLSNTQSDPLGAGMVETEFVDHVTPVGFARFAEELCVAGRLVLDDTSDEEAVARWQEQAARLRKLFRHMESAQRRDCEKLYKVAVTLEARMQDALADGAEMSDTEAAFVALEALEREAFGFTQ
jgi:hypothetical protein